MSDWSHATADENAFASSSNAGDAQPTCILRKKNKETVAASLESASRVAGIEELELRHFQLDQISAIHLDKLFSGCQQCLQRLRLVNCALSDTFFSLSTERLAQNHVQLTHFAMNNCSPLSMTALISMTALFSHVLTSLELSSCKLARQAGIILSQSLPSCTALRSLNLADNNLRDGGLRAIVDALKAMAASTAGSEQSKSQQHTQQDGDDDDIEQIVGLDALDVSRNGITAAGFSAFNHAAVRRLNVSDNAIESVGPFLLTNAAIASLDLSGNVLSEDGAHELISTLFREQTSLQSLDLRRCVLSTTSAAFLRKTLRQSSFCPLKILELDEVCHERDCAGAGASGVDKSRQCLDEIARTGAQKYPHLHVRLSKALVSVQESHRHPKSAKTQGASHSNSGVAHDAVLPVDAAELRNTVATIAAEALGSAKAHEVQEPATANHVESSRVPAQSQQAQQCQQLAMVASPSSSSHSAPQLQHVDVEYIVSKTIECMNQNFEQRLGLFLLKMENQQQERNTSQVQFLAAKVEACERAIPRLEARLDVLSDRVTAGNAQLAKLQSEFQHQLQQVRHDVLAVAKETHSQSHHSQQQQQQLMSGSTLPPTTPLSLVMQSQVEDFVTARARASEQLAMGEVQRLRRETNPQAIVDAISSHLAQFKHEFDANQSSVLCKFTESIVKDSVRLDERMHRVEAQIGSLETVIQAEQQASLLALEAISDAFATGNSSGSGDSASEAPLTPVRSGYGTPTRTGGSGAVRRR